MWGEGGGLAGGVQNALSVSAGGASLGGGSGGTTGMNK